MKRPWVVWTNHAKESPRKGFGDAELGRTLRHLANRGDGHCRLQAERSDGDEVPPIIVVDLAEYRT